MVYELNDWHLNPGTSLTAIQQAQLDLAFKLPPDYAGFLLDHDGGEGFVGEDYIILFRVEELTSSNRSYEVQEWVPGLLLFGSNGGGEGYAFDMRKANPQVVRVPFIGMSLDHTTTIANSFAELMDFRG